MGERNTFTAWSQVPFELADLVTVSGPQCPHCQVTLWG